MKILVIGGLGMAGHVISKYLMDQGHDIHILARRHSDIFQTIVADALDFKLLKDIIKKFKFDVIINAAGILNNYAEENKSEAILINSYLPNYLRDITVNSEIKVVQISTDCVFSGEKGNYDEKAFKDGESFYAKTKALGELDDQKNLTFRTSIIGPDMNEKGIGLFNWFMSQNNKVQGFEKVYWTGVTTLTLAKAIGAAIDQNTTGLYNLVNNRKISKYELLMLFNKYFKKNKIKIDTCNEKVSDKSLINTRNDFNFIVPDYEDMIKDMEDWIKKNREIYKYEFEN